MTSVTQKGMAKFYLGIIVLIILIIGCVFLDSHRDSSISCTLHADLNKNVFSNSSEPTRTLVVYVYAKSHGFTEKNLEFFIRIAVREHHDADYYFILQQIDNISFDETKLPRLPPNAHYVQHENKCFDIGTVGWFLSSGRVDKTKYRYFIFLNSSIRGPFIVSYYDSLVWYTIFTRRLNNETKLVGCTISCEQAPQVQSYLWALDLGSLNLLLQKETIFACHNSKVDAIDNAEVRASQSLLQSGFAIDSLMKKYQGVDFRLDANKKCNNAKIPTISKAVDGISLDPFEVVFVKVKDRDREYKDTRERVKVYDKWIH